MHVSEKFSSEVELKEKLDYMYEQSRKGRVFHGLLEVAFNEVTIVTAIHNIKSNSGAMTAGVDKIKVDKYLQMNRNKLIQLIQTSVSNYKPKPVRRVYIEKANGKRRPLGIATILDRIIQECIRIVLEPIVEARFYPHSYGFRPYRACKHAVRQLMTIINNGKGVQPVYAIEGDIKGYFDNINHRLLLRKLWNLGIHDKRIIAIIKEMLVAGYIENDLFNRSEVGTPQGGIISPLLANVYLNDFDWYIGRQYHIPVQKCINIGSDRARLKMQGITPKYLIRYADDWILLTITQQEAQRMLIGLKKYFKHKYKLELSDEKTIITDLRERPAKFLGFCLLVEKARNVPGKITDRPVLKVYPNPEKVKKQIKTLCGEVRKIGHCPREDLKAIQIEKVNTIIVGVADYWKIAICSKTFNDIDYVVMDSAYATFKKLYGAKYTEHKIPLKMLSNQPLRHRGHDCKTYAVKIDDLWIGITKAFVTHCQWEKKSYNQKMTPYTEEGRQLYLARTRKGKNLPLARPTLYDVELLEYSPEDERYNFEYFMNREYAYNRDKGICRCCKTVLTEDNRHCHQMYGELPINKINKVPNLIWLCKECDVYIHGKPTPDGIAVKIARKIKTYRARLQLKDSSHTVFGVSL